MKGDKETATLREALEFLLAKRIKQAETRQISLKQKTEQENRVPARTA